MITIEVDTALQRLKAEFAGAKKAQVNEVTAKTLNAAMRVARIQGAKEISRVYNVSDLSIVTSKLRGRNATANDLTSYLYADRLGIQLRNFAAASSIGGRKSYLSVEIRRGARQEIRSAFITKARAGAGNELTGVFARGGYVGKEFKFRTKRLVQYPAPDMPIGLLRTTSPFSMLNDDAVRERMSDAAQKHFETAFVKNMRKLFPL
jgi:hypothetical protein